MRALACLPTDLLLPDDVAKRDLALHMLRNKADRSWGGRWSLENEQYRLLKAAIRVGEACVFTGPAACRRPRSSAELAALRDLVRWARGGGDSRQRAAFVTACRTPEWHDGLPIVRWHEPAAGEVQLGPLELPPRHILAALTRQDPASLHWQTHSFRIDDPQSFADSIAAFDGITLEPLRIPSAESSMRLPRGITELDIRRLPHPLYGSALSPLISHLPDLQYATHTAGQSPETTPATIEDLKTLLLDQIDGVSRDNRDRLNREHAPRLERVLVAARERPELSDGIQAILRRETGYCFDANVMRLDEIEALVDAGAVPPNPADRALYYFRQALAFRARQSAAHRDQEDDENLEIAHGLAWAVDRRLGDLLGLRPGASEPLYRRHARLPGAVDKGAPVNDVHAADAVISAEIAEGFPTLAFFASGAHAFSPGLVEALNEDEVFQATSSTIEKRFGLAHEAAAALAPEDDEAGFEDYLTKEADLIRARVDRLAHHLQPALTKLRAAGIGAGPAR